MKPKQTAIGAPMTVFRLGMAIALAVLSWRSAASQDHERPGAMRSIREFGVSPANSSEKNREALQAAIDWAAARGAALFVEPTST